MTMTMAMAMSLGPTLLYAAKHTHQKMTPILGESKKIHSVRTIRIAVVSRCDLSFLGGDEGGGGRISRPGQTPSHHAGISYPVRVQPLTPIRWGLQKLILICWRNDLREFV